jgi:hypothetical protein
MPTATRWLGLLFLVAHLMALAPAILLKYARPGSQSRQKQLRRASHFLNHVCAVGAAFWLPYAQSSCGFHPGVSYRHHNSGVPQPSVPQVQLQDADVSNCFTTMLYMAVLGPSACREVLQGSRAEYYLQQLYWAFESFTDFLFASHGLIYEGQEPSPGSCLATIRFIQFLAAFVMPGSIYVLERRSRQAFRKGLGSAASGVTTTTRCTSTPACLAPLGS